MPFFREYIIQKVLIEAIDFDNEYYKLSKNTIEDRLESSILSSGVLSPPVLLKERGIYIIIFGHNRLRILRQSDTEDVDSVIIKELTPELFLDYSLLKIYRDEIGPVGRAKLMLILRNDFNLDIDSLSNVARSAYFPLEYINMFELSEHLVRLPRNLRDYIDIKGIGYKVIKKILSIPNDGIQKMDEWVKDTNMRVNIFKKVVDLLVDIHKRDKTFCKLKDIDINSLKDKRGKEDHIYHELFNLRYPEYTRLRRRADSIISSFKRRGLKIDFPEYFEGDGIDLHLSINKRDDIESIKDKLGNTDTEELRNLLELL